MNSIIDVIDPELKFSISEDQAEVDGVHVLAKVKGEFFVPNGKSRNGRFYPKALWEKVISDKGVQAKLQKRSMYGTVGHDADLSDRAVREGVISHVMTSLKIDGKGRGIGEALILGTPTGKILNTMLRAGSQLHVSSRANGTFKSEKKDGLPVVDEDSYTLDGWDFVIDPGFLEAQPSLVESLDKAYEKQKLEGDTSMNTNKDNSMDSKLVEHIANQNEELRTSVSNLTDEVKALEETNKDLKEENDHVKVELEKFEETNKSLAEYKEFGTAEEIKEKLEKSEEDAKVLEAYNELADSPEAAKTTLEGAKAFIQEMVETFGGKETIKENSEFKAQVDELGTLEQITKVLETYDAILEEKQTAERAEKITALSKELKVDEEKITSFLEKHTEEEVRELFKTVTESLKIEEDGDEDKFKKKKFDENNKNNDNTDDADRVDVSESKVLGTSRADRIGKRFNKR